MPDFSDFADAPLDTSTFSYNNDAPTMGDHKAAATLTTPGVDGNPFLTLAGMAPAAAVDLGDTVLSSLSGIGVGPKRGDTSNALYGAIGQPGLNKFVQDHQGGIEAMSGIGGLVASELLARKITAPAGAAMTMLSKVPYVRRLATLESAYQNSMTTVRAVDASLAARGAMGLEQFVGEATVTGMKFDRAIGEFASAEISGTRSQAVMKAKGLGFALGARNAAVTEGVAASILHNNSFLYSDDAGQNLMWQALGVATGGALDYYHAAYGIRKFVNSDSYRRAFAGALDPLGHEEDRLFWNKTGVKPMEEHESFLGGSYTDQVTSYMVGASNLKDLPVSGPDARALLTNREKLATQQQELGFIAANKVTTKGLTSDGSMGFSMDTPEYGGHVKLMMLRDPGSMMGVESLGGLSPDMVGPIDKHSMQMRRISDRIDEVEEIIANPDSSAREMAAAQALRKRLDYESSLTPFSVVDGERMPITEGEVFHQWAEPHWESVPLAGPVGQMGDDAHAVFVAKAAKDSVNPVSVDTQFGIHIPGGKDLGKDADLFDVMRLYRAGNRAIDRMSTFAGPIQVPEGANWFQLDMAKELAGRNPEAKILWPKGMDADSAQVESLAQKAEVMGYWVKQNKINQARLKLNGQDSESMMSKVRLRLNLPKLTAYERGVTGETEHPVERLLRGIDAFGPNKVRAMTLDQLKESTATFKRLGDMVPASKDDLDHLMGNSFSFMLTDKGEPLRPLMGYSRPMTMANDWSTDVVAERLAARAMLKAQVLTTGDQLTSSVANAIYSSPDIQQAMATHMLADTQIQGSTIGGAPQSWLGAIGRVASTREWIGRDNPTMLAAARISDLVGRVVRDNMKQVLTNAFGDSLNLLKNPRNAAHELLLDQFHSFSPGWDLERKAVPDGQGYNKFMLSDTAGNRLRWKNKWGSELPNGQSLLSPDGKEVVLSDLALDLQTRLNTATDAWRESQNTLLRANNMPEIRAKAWYVPPRNTDGKYMGFVIGPDGKSVPNMSIVAATPAEYARQAAAMQPELERLGMGYSLRDQDSIKQFATMLDRAQMDMINPNTTAIKPNKKGTGALEGAEVGIGRFQESLKTLREGLLAHGSDIKETIFKEQLNSAKARAQVSSVMTRNKQGIDEVKFKSLADMYQDNLMGTSSLQGSAIGRVYDAVEGSIDKAFEAAAGPFKKAQATTGDLWNMTNAWINRNTPWSTTPAAKKDFDRLSQELGKHMPFDNAAAFLEAKGAGAVPLTARQVASNLNRFSAGMLLRWGESAHAIMNLSGVINAMPAVVRHFTPNEAELASWATGGAEEYSSRVGHSATIFNLPNGVKIGIPDMAKLAANGYKDAWHESRHVDFDYMVQRGYLSQEVAEFHKQFGAIEARGNWSKFFNGDQTIKNPKGLKQQLAAKGLDGWMGVISDKSEDFSRSWAHMIGLNLADTLGIAAREDKHAFAHDLANKMIANYAPENRPEIFQGAMGTTIGLFQSFAQAYWQRLFRYVETKDYASLGTQMAMQGAIFGVNTLPGWSQFNSLVSNVRQDHQDVNSGLRNRLGSNAHGGTGSLADFMLNGTLSNIPTLFGGPGVDLYSRGDVNIRVPAIGGVDSIPAYAVVGKILNGIGEAAGAMQQGTGMSRTQLAEILAHTISNRPIAGWIERMADDGNQVDRYGQLVTETKGYMEGAYRLMGLRSERQSNELNQFYAQKNAQTHKAAADAVLNLATRAAMREGNTDAMPAIYQKYMENGGDPRYFSRWAKRNFEAATSTRGERNLTTQMKRTLRDPKAMDQVVRMLDAGVSVDQDEKTPDPSTYFGDQDRGEDELNQGTGAPGQYTGQMTMP